MTPAATPTESGLINAFVLDGRGGARALRSWAEVAQWRPDHGSLWLHLMRSAEGLDRWLEDAAGGGLDEATAGALLEGSTRPRVIRVRGGTLCTLRGVNLNEGAEPDDMISLRLWIEKDRLISVRREHFDSVRQVMDGLRGGIGPETLGGVLSELTEALIDRVDTIVDGAADTLDELEDRILPSTHESGADMDTLGDLRRQLLTIHRHLAPQLAVLARLDKALPDDFFTEADRRRLAEAENQLTRILEDLDAAKSRAAVLQDQIEVRLSARLHKRLYLISIIATVALPLTLVTGLLGMNVGGVPFGPPNDAGFFIVLIGMIVLAAVAIIVLRTVDWL